MLKKISFLLISIFLITSCHKKKDSTEKTKLKEEIEKIPKTNTEHIQIRTESTKIKKKVTECKCFNGIGSTNEDTPTLQFDFSNGISLSVCGYFDKDKQVDKNLVMSEFNIFECSTGNSLVEYDATQTCLIKETPDKLIIEELYYLPSGENWTYNLINLTRQIISINKNEIIVSEPKPNLKAIELEKKMEIDFLNSIKKGEGIPSEWELEIGKLVVVSLNGNEKAWNILRDYENFTGETTDGALAESWKEAVSLVESMINK